MWLSLWLLTAHCVSHLHSLLSPTPSIAVHGSCLPVNSDRCGCRGERLRPPACPTLYPDTAPASRCRARMSAPAVINSLWRLHKFRCQPDTSACLSEPSITDCRVPSSNRPGAILTATFLPPIEEAAACITSPRHGNSHSPSATPDPNPKPRCADRRCTCSTTADGQPLCRLRAACGPRHGGVG